MIDEVNYLINDLDISGEHAYEIINIYFECYGDSWTYEDYLHEEIRVIKNNKENQRLIAELETVDDVALLEGDDYVLLTNYSTLQRMGEIGDCLPTHPF